MAKQSHRKEHEKPPVVRLRASDRAPIYSEFREKLPTWPPEARYFRRYTTLREALHALRVQTPAVEQMRAELMQAAERLIEALDGGEAAVLLAFDKWRDDVGQRAGVSDFSRDHPSDLVRLAAELDELIPPLVGYYTDPAEYVRGLAPRLYPHLFGEGARRVLEMKKHHPLNQDGFFAIVDDGSVAYHDGQEPAEWLGRLLWTFGYAALLNDTVREIAASLPPRHLRDALSLAEGKKPFRDGRPSGVKESNPRPRKVDHEARAAAVRAMRDEWEKQNPWRERGGLKKSLDAVAAAEKREPAAIRNSVKIAKTRAQGATEEK